MAAFLHELRPLTPFRGLLRSASLTTEQCAAARVDFLAVRLRLRAAQERLMLSSPPSLLISALAPIAITNRMISSEYISGMLKML